jgi:hypothetical protein
MILGEDGLRQLSGIAAFFKVVDLLNVSGNPTRSIESQPPKAICPNHQTKSQPGYQNFAERADDERTQALF